MDSVRAERAGLLKDLDEVNSELRRVHERLSDDGFIMNAKPDLIDAESRLLTQLIERRARIQANLVLVEERRLGGLPSSQVGTWSPLALHETVPAATHFLDEPLPPPPAANPPVAPSSTSPEWLSQMIAGVMMVKRGKKTVRELANAVHLAGDHVPTLRLFAAAFDSLGHTGRATDVRLKISKLSGEAEVHGRSQLEPAPRIIPLAPMPPAEELPDARDGLTRMQRIVLCAMHALWFRADGPMKKTALLIEELRLAETPITAQQVEETLTRLTHPWSRRNPLVEVAGLSCRLTPLAEELFGDLDLLELEPGFSIKIPRVLAAPIPLLLAKGTDGVPPHHLADLIQAALHRLQFPGAGLNSFLNGPEYPSGGVKVHFPQGTYDGFSGLMTVRARIDLQIERSSRKARILISELPWPLDRAEVIAALARLELEGVARIGEDGSDRISVELEHVAYAATVREILRASHSLRQSTDVELRVNVDGAAVSTGLVTLVDHFLNHRRSVVSRRLEKEMSGLQSRSQAIEGLLVVTQLLDVVTKVITHAEDPAEQFWGLTHITSPEFTSRVSFAPLTPWAPTLLNQILAGLKARLKTEVPDAPESPTHSYEHGFSEVQARAIIATRRLSAIPVDALFREWAELSSRIATLETPLRERSALEALVHAELIALRARHSSPRRTLWHE